MALEGVDIKPAGRGLNCYCREPLKAQLSVDLIGQSRIQSNMKLQSFSFSFYSGSTFIFVCKKSWLVLLALAADFIQDNNGHLTTDLS